MSVDDARMVADVTIGNLNILDLLAPDTAKARVEEVRILPHWAPAKGLCFAFLKPYLFCLPSYSLSSTLLSLFLFDFMCYAYREYIEGLSPFHKMLCSLNP